MSAVFRYIAWDDSWSVDLGATSIRLGKVPGFTELANLGAVGTGSITYEDTSGGAGHASDEFLSFQQFAVDETAASPERIFMGWTGDDIEDVPGPENANDSLRTGVQKRIEINLEDGNTLAGRRIIQPKALDATVSRPAETAAARITWLLGTNYFSGVADNGQVHPASITLDANDYSGSHPADVLNDCCTATGDNWFVYWDRDAAAWSLAVFNMTTYAGYVASFGLSNVPGIYDSSTAGAGVSNVWVVEGQPRRKRSAASLATGVLYPYAKGSVYETSGSGTYPVVDRTATSTSVKTSTLATTKANRYLTDNAEPVHLIDCNAKVLAAHVNDALAGQLIVGSFRQFPEYTTASYFRIAGKTVSQVEESDEFYLCNFQLVPAAPVTPTSTFAVLDRGYVASSGAIDTPGLGSYEMGYSGTGDAPPSSSNYPVQPKTGLIAYYLGGAGGVIPIGFTVSGSGTLTAVAQVKPELGYNGTGMTLEMRVLVNGAQVASSGVFTDPSGGGPHTIDPDLTINASISVSSGDHITTSFIIGGHASEIGSVPIAGIFAPPYQFSVTGDLS